jgi:hypothetical protein
VNVTEEFKLPRLLMQFSVKTDGASTPEVGRLETTISALALTAKLPYINYKKNLRKSD